jgi:hypothetical protein
MRLLHLSGADLATSLSVSPPLRSCAVAIFMAIPTVVILAIGRGFGSDSGR